MKWRVVKWDEQSAALNMGLDEAVGDMVSEGSSPPTIRFYGWKPSAVSIGYFQKIRDEVDLDSCKRQGVERVRRRTGGGAVYHDREGEITYSVIAPAKMFPKGVTSIYGIVCNWIVDGLKEIGIESEFKPINDIIANGKKISGNAATIRNGVLLQHGTIICKLDVKKMFSVLNVSKEKISDKMIKSVEDRVTSVHDICGAEKGEVLDALINGFTKGKEFEFGEWSEKEREMSKENAEKRYGNDEWNFMR